MRSSIRAAAKTREWRSSLDCVEYYQVKSLPIESTGGEPLDIDGEVIGHAPFLAEVMTGAMELFT